MKKILIGYAVVFVAMVVMSIVVDGLILGSTYASLNSLWRPDMQSKAWIYYVIMIVSSFFFSFIFSKGYKGKGITWKAFATGCSSEYG